VAAVTALPLIDANDRDELFFGLRSILTTRIDDFPIFEELFAAFWDRQSQKWELLEKRDSNSGLHRNSPKSTARGLGFFLEHWAKEDEASNEPLKTTTASEIESSGVKDFSAFSHEKLDQISQLARRIVKRLAKNPSRRWQPVRQGPRLNLRRSLRLSLKTGGELIELAHRQRKPKRTKLVVICDVSGSMDLYSRFLLQFVYGLQNSFATVETFVFSTSLSRITGYLKNRTYQRALDRLSSKVRGWSGGTRIGASLADFNASWLKRIDKRTIVIILSDGWDTGEPELLAAELSRLQQSAGRLIWLNPLLGSSGFKPLTRGMQAALPFINVFASAHDLGSLQALESHLVL
ncbi:MAG TPA: VWA domain-containing protein, partial [Pyrinomonadaceae bacterium]|nr:VWA domain-containing protein [Pyrinomonadaceae bacterium]